MNVVDSPWGQALSDLADGRASQAQLDRVLAAWEAQPELRQQWQGLHLIGDTLRSSELAGQAQSADALLAGLRERLASEEEAPLPRASALHGLRAWMAPLAVAAGFVAVALVMPSLQGLVQPPELPSLAQAGAPSPLDSALNSESSFVQAAGLRDRVFDAPAPSASDAASAVARR